MNGKMELLKVLKELHNISSFRLSIYDTTLHEIEAFPKELCSFCKLIQKNEIAKDICVKNDRLAFEIAEQTQDVYIYQCRFGLYEAVAPLYSFGVLTGYLMMGQITTKDENSKTKIIALANKYIYDEFSLKEAIEKIPTGSKEQLLSCIAIMDICAKYITLTNRLNNIKSDLAYEIKKYIDENYYKSISIETLCQMFFCSKSTLINAYKKKYNQSINHYLMSKRIEHACDLLLLTNKSIKDISLSCGFSDQNYFSKVFYNIQKKSPTEYRKSQTNNMG